MSVSPIQKPRFQGTRFEYVHLPNRKDPLELRVTFLPDNQLHGFQMLDITKPTTHASQEEETTVSRGLTDRLAEGGWGLLTLYRMLFASNTLPLKSAFAPEVMLHRLPWLNANGATDHPQERAPLFDKLRDMLHRFSMDGHFKDHPEYFEYFEKLSTGLLSNKDYVTVDVSRTDNGGGFNTAQMALSAGETVRTRSSKQSSAILDEYKDRKTIEGTVITIRPSAGVVDKTV